MSELGVLGAVWVAHCAADAEADSDSLERQLAETLSAATEAWPSVELGAHDYIAYLADRVSDHSELGGLRTDDLYLACGCLKGLTSALLAFEANMMAATDGALSRMDKSGDMREDIKQELRTVLFTGDADRPPKIYEYQGTGSLRRWVQVMATRRGLNRLRRQKHEVKLNDWQLADAVDEGELGHLKEIYRHEFKSAFESAFETLEPEQRNLLRLNLIDGLSIDQIASLHNIHRATAARRLGSVRAKLADETRQYMGEKLKLEQTDLDSLLRMVRSRVDLSLQRMFAAEVDD